MNKKYKNASRYDQLDKEIEELEQKIALGSESTEEDENLPTVTPTPTVAIDNTAVDWEKRYSDLRSFAAREKNALQKELEEEKARLEAIKREQKETDFPRPKNREELVEWMRKYPDITGNIRTLIAEELSSSSDVLKKDIEELKKSKQELDQQRALQQLLERHPDFIEIRKTKEFQEWVQRQPQERGSVVGKALFDALRGYDAEAAANAVDIYKSDLERSKKKKGSDAKDAATTVVRTVAETPSTGEKRKFRESEIEKMSIREYERFEGEIEQARLDNRIVYDVTGAAR